jgi:hypothetical protein
MAPLLIKSIRDRRRRRLARLLARNARWSADAQRWPALGGVDDDADATGTRSADQLD